MSLIPAIVRRLRVPLVLVAVTAVTAVTALTGLATATAARIGTAAPGAVTAAASADTGAAVGGPAGAGPVTGHQARLTARTSPAGMAKPDTAQTVMASARQAIASAAVPDTCSGAISPDTVYPCTTPSAAGAGTFTLTLPDVTDLLLIQVIPVGGSPADGTLPLTLTAPDGTAVTCAESGALYSCHTAQAGTYTLAVTGQGSTSYTVAYLPLLSDASCATANPSFATPGTSGTLAAGETGACFSLNMLSGHVLDLQFATGATVASAAVYDSTGAPACELDASGHCALTGTGPYRVLVSAPYGEATSYHLQLHDLTDPAGCTVAAQETFGQVPASGTDQCRTLTVTTAGGYRIYANSSVLGNNAGTVYTQAGVPVCTGVLAAVCTLPAGTYDFVADNAYQESFGVVFIAAGESQGCVNAGDTDFASGPATVTFGGPGEVICLTLPTASGQSDFIYDPPPASGYTVPAMTIVDSTGAEQCSAVINQRSDTCTITGTTPLRVLLSDPIANASYVLYVQKTDSTAGCAPWPASGFGGTWGATVALSGPADVKCLAIPAGQHTASELTGFSNAAHAADGSVAIFGPDGQEACLIGLGEGLCHYQSGVTYTAVVRTTAPGGDTYDLARRDVTSSAQCSGPATAVGGPSTTVTLTSELDAYCFRVSGTASDKFWISLRGTTAEATATNPFPPQGAFLVTDASGNWLCPGSYACDLTGSPDYQILVIAEYYAGKAITAHLDTWLVGTASGWVPQCQTHHFTAGTTWGPVNGTLTEKAAGYCAVVDVTPGQTFSIQGADSASATHPMSVDVYPAANWDTGSGNLCSNWFPFPAQVQLLFRCTLGGASTSPAVTALLLLTPGEVPGPVTYGFWGADCQSSQCPPIAPLITSLTPAAQVASSASQVVVTGSELTWNTPFALTGSAGQVAAGTPVAVNPAGTQLTVKIDTSHLPLGRYGATVGDPSYTAGTASPGYLPGAYTVTAVPKPAAPPVRFTPVTPARVLDTARGLRAPRRGVPGHSVLTLKVTGLAGVPVSNVAAVAVELTAVSPARSGQLTAYPAGTARRDGSSLVFTAGRTATSLAVVPVRDGEIALYNGSAGKLGLTVDLAGYYAAGSRGLRFAPVAPHRVLDTRRGLGARRSRVAARHAITITVTGAGGVPANGVTAVALDVTAIGPARAGHLTAYAAGTARRDVTDLSFAAHQASENLIIVPVRNRKVTLGNSSGGPLDLTADVTGYFAAGRGPGFYPATPRLVLNTRTGLGGARGQVAARSVAVTRVAGVNGIPSTVSAVVLSVAVSGARRAGTLTVYPDGRPRPASPSLAFATGNSGSALVIVPVVNGRIDFRNGSSAPVQLTAAVEGYYAP